MKIIDVRSHLIEVSFFKDQFSTIPETAKITLGELFGSDHVVREKKGGACFSPTTYNTGATRSNEGVKHISAIILDFDEVSRSVYESVVGRVDKMAKVIYTTYRHFLNGQDDFRFRLVLPTSRMFSPEEFYLLFPYSAELLGNVHDKGASEPARIFFLPSCPQNRKGYSFIQYSNGFLLDVDRGIELAKAKPRKKFSPNQSGLDRTLPLVSLATLKNVFDECDAFGLIRNKIKKGETLGHWEGFSLLFLCQLIKGGVEWFTRRIPGWGKTEQDLRQIEKTLGKGYAPLSCRRLGEIGLCPHAGQPNPCLAEREEGKPRSPVSFLYGKKSIKNVRIRNEARFKGGASGSK